MSNAAAIQLRLKKLAAKIDEVLLTDQEKSVERPRFRTVFETQIRSTAEGLLFRTCPEDSCSARERNSPTVRGSPPLSCVEITNSPHRDRSPINERVQIAVCHCPVDLRQAFLKVLEKGLPVTVLGVLGQKAPLRDSRILITNGTLRVHCKQQAFNAAYEAPKRKVVICYPWGASGPSHVCGVVVGRRACKVLRHHSCTIMTDRSPRIAKQLFLVFPTVPSSTLLTLEFLDRFKLIMFLMALHLVVWPTERPALSRGRVLWMIAHCLWASRAKHSRIFSHPTKPC